ncbi:hypothetical protein SAMN05444959_101223 [Paracoccus seriniphilus]|uniref:Uncharacterized protein n=2 Tax=Paracoccus seriniphilus TaxID=184748 RepID=A0A239PND5_9RHOB|nr:hypothetical protein SAMN05444959_101223 [Paracoccus seriniphilus]
MIAYGAESGEKNFTDGFFWRRPVTKMRRGLITQPWLSWQVRLLQIDRMTNCLRPLLSVIAMLVLTLAASAANAEIRAHGPYIDIINDKGGNVMAMAQRRGQLARSGKQVRIRGYCRSACTMLVTLPNACIGPKARIGFHAPRLPNTNIIPPMVDQIMGNFYRNGIRERWFGGWNRSLEMTVISARDYVRLDPQTRICSSLGGKKK